MNNPRPINLNLFTIHLPIAGLMSIAHRISGFFIFILTPWLIYKFELSLRSNLDFQQAIDISPFSSKLLLIMISWAISHHLLAGIRYLFLDADIGFDKPFYRWSALLVLTGGVLIALLTAVLIL